MLERTEHYLGEWHLHPKSNPTPSATDIAQMKKIAQDKNFNCKEPILMILGEVAKVKVISLSICKNDQILYYDERAEIYEDT